MLNIRWKNIFVDFVTGLLLSEEYNDILIVIDGLTRMRDCIAIHITITVEDIVDLYVNYIYRLYGFSGTVVLDREP